MLSSLEINPSWAQRAPDGLVGKGWVKSGSVTSTENQVSELPIDEKVLQDLEHKASK